MGAVDKHTKASVCYEAWQQTTAKGTVCKARKVQAWPVEEETQRGRVAVLINIHTSVPTLFPKALTYHQEIVKHNLNVTCSVLWELNR